MSRKLAILAILLLLAIAPVSAQGTPVPEATPPVLVVVPPEAPAAASEAISDAYQEQFEMLTDIIKYLVDEHTDLTKTAGTVLILLIAVQVIGSFLARLTPWAWDDEFFGWLGSKLPWNRLRGQNKSVIASVGNEDTQAKG